MPTKKTEASPKEAEKKFMIVLNMPGAPKNSAHLFQIDNSKYYVPYNKQVEVPEWVYILYLDSEFNPLRKVTDGVNEEHIIVD